MSQQQGEDDGAKPQLPKEAYTVGWICAISTEHVAARVLLDQHHEIPEHIEDHDNNTYTLGKMGEHNVAIVVLPDGEYGTTAAATVARDMLKSFPNIRIGLMVGVGDGAPSAQNDIRLGDVVVSAPRDGHGGVFQYDFGKTIQDQVFRETGFLAQPPQVLRTAVNTLKGLYEIDGHQIQGSIEKVLQSKPRLRKKYSMPDMSTDRLYRADVTHPLNAADCTTSCATSSSAILSRRVRGDEDDSPTIHYGLIASANQLMKNALVRDKLANEKGVLCFEMEAAGLMNHFPCVVVRGICDYSDTHKNKEWQGYAAMTAAAYAKDLLKQVAPKIIAVERKLSEVVAQVAERTLDIRNHVVHSESILKGQKDREILDWLTRLDHGSQHSGFLRSRQTGTGEWLLRSSQYQAWVDDRQQILYCPGLPGAGKTILAATVIDDLERKFKFDNVNTAAIAYIYCNYKRKDEQKVEDLIASLIRQIALSRPCLPVAVKELYDKHSRKQTRPMFDEVVQTLHFIVLEFLRVFVVVDALDECQTSDDCRRKLLETIFQLQAQRGINLFATSRDIPEISHEFVDHPFLEIRASDDDIRRCLEGNLKRFHKFVTENEALKEELITRLIEAVGGMFLLARLYLNALLEEDTPYAVRQALGNMVSGAHNDNAYSAAYESAMDRIIEGQSTRRAARAKQVLGWITLAWSELHETELQHALAVDDEDTDLDHEKCPSNRLFGLCLRRTGDSGEGERSHSVGTVRVSISETLPMGSFADDVVGSYTTQEYFESTKSRWFPTMELDMTLTCTTYLSFESFARGPCQTDEEFEVRIDEHSLYSYAARYWGLHAYAAGRNDKVLSFLSQHKKVDAAGQALYASGIHTRRPDDYSQDVLQRTALHLTSLFGLVWAASDRLSHGDGVDVVDTTGQTPLHLASQQGHLNIVELLIEKGASVNIADRRGWTPLHRASHQGHLEVAELLLDNGADVKIADNRGWTPLHRSIRHGHVEVAELFINKGADVKVADGRGRTPLHRASALGDPYMTALLIRQGAEVMAETNEDQSYEKRTPLHCAARHGHLEAVKVLFTQGLHSKEGDPSLTAALWDALWLMHEETATYLIANCGAILNAKMLIMASEHNQPAVVEWLLKRGLDPNCTDHVPDSHDTESCCSDKQKDDRNAVSRPLYGAAKWGWGKVVRVLLHNGANVNLEGGAVGTPLQVAALGGFLDIVTLLLEHGADVNLWPDAYYGPAVTCSAYACQDDVTEALIKAGADINIPGGHLDNSLNASVREYWSGDHHRKPETIWHTSDAAGTREVFRGTERVTELLLDNGADVKLYGAQALSTAVRACELRSVTLLLNWGCEFDFSVPGSACLSEATQHAIESGDDRILQVLLEHKSDPNMAPGPHDHEDWGSDCFSEDGSGPIEAPENELPLCLAVYGNSYELAKILIRFGAVVNTETRGLGSLSSPMHAACKSGNPIMVKLLIEHEGDVNGLFRDDIRHPSRGTSGPGRDYHSHKGTTSVLQSICARQSEKMDELVTILLDAGASPSARNADNHTVLETLFTSMRWNADRKRNRRKPRASGGTVLKTAQLLLNRGADPHASGGLYSGALEAAVLSENVDLIKLMLRQGISPSVMLDSSLQAAARAGCTEIVKLLLENGADPNASAGKSPGCRKEDTALHAAAFTGQAEVVRILLDARADPTIDTRYGTVWETAIVGLNRLIQCVTRWDDWNDRDLARFADVIEMLREAAPGMPEPSRNCHYGISCDGPGEICQAKLHHPHEMAYGEVMPQDYIRGARYECRSCKFGEFNLCELCKQIHDRDGWPPREWNKPEDAKSASDDENRWRRMGRDHDSHSHEMIRIERCEFIVGGDKLRHRLEEVLKLAPKKKKLKNRAWELAREMHNSRGFGESDDED